MNIHAVIVTYNGETWIKGCLDSMTNIQHPVHIHIVDNGSTDETLAICSNYKLNIISNNENLGFGAANNLGIKWALDEGATHVLLLNQDAYLDKNCIKNFLGNKDAHKTDRIFSFLQLNGDGSDFDINWKAHYLKESNCPNFLNDYKNSALETSYPILFTNAAAWLIPKEILLIVGGFSPSFFHYGEDNNYIHRLHYHSFKLVLLPDCKVLHDRTERTGGFHAETAQKQRSFLLKISHPRNYQSAWKIRFNLWRILIQKIIRGQKMQDCIELLHLQYIQNNNMSDVITNRNKTRKDNGPFIVSRQCD